MFRSSYIFGIVLLLLVPFSMYAAEDTGVIGSNLGLDFYSRIDDAGDALAQGILLRRIGEKRTYGALGCGATWIAGEPIDPSTLDGLRNGDPTILVSLARSKQVTLTTESESSLRQCLVEKYNELDRAAHEDQNTLETVGNVGLYLDGDTANSDYDILTDISRINSVIFKEKYPYTGNKNASAKSIANLLRGDPVAPLLPPVGTTNASPNITVSGGATSSSSSSQPAAPTTTLSGSSTLTTDILPWASVCARTGSASTIADGLFGDGLLDDINSTLAGGVSSIGRLAYTPPPGSRTLSSTSTGSPENMFGLSQGSDFYNQPVCSGILCIKIKMVSGGSSGLGGFSNTSIESLLEKHTKMMDPISWSDLGYQEMSMNSYEDPKKNKNFAKQLAGARVYTQEAPQISKRLKTEDTQFSKDAVFDRAVRCAMNEAGLPGDPILANGWIGAGYTGLRDTTSITNRTTPLGPIETDNLRGCYQTRLGIGQKESYQSLSTDLNEIQAFTQAMMSTILSIIDTDRKLDTLPVK